MNKNTHVGQWLGTVRLTAAFGGKENKLYGLAYFSIDHDQPNRFCFSFSRVKGFAETNVFLVPSFRLNGSVSHKDKGRILELKPDKVTAREYIEFLSDKSAGEQLNFDNYDDFLGMLREDAGWDVPSKFELHYQRPSPSDLAFNPNSTKGSFLNITKNGNDIFEVSMLKSFYRQERTSTDELQLPWKDFLSWAEKKQAADSSSSDFLFRGQSDKNHRLTTTLARRGRFDLTRYWSQTAIDALIKCHEASIESFPKLFPEEGVLRHPDELAPSVSRQLHRGFRWLRHRGSPSPLMDWSLDSKVALYFAYCPQEPKEDRVVYCLDFGKYSQDWSSSSVQHKEDPMDPRAMITRLQWLEASEGCKREGNQKGVYVFSAIEDVEYMLRQLEIAYEHATGQFHAYLYRFVLPYEDRNEVLSFLDSENINEATLFPGEDGFVRNLNKKDFGEI